MIQLAISACLCVLALGCEQAPALACNGHAELCDRPLNHVAFAATHNSMSHEDDGWWGANQEHGLTDQLQDGIRGMLLDTYEIDGELFLCHGFCELGKQRLSEGLGEIRTFLEGHPSEVLILIFQDGVSTEKMAQAIEGAGLLDHVYEHVANGPFPTLRDLVLSGQRLLISAESGGPPPGYYHHAWDLFWDTPYEFGSVEEFSCALNRGSAANPLFLLNHWVADAMGLPSKKAAAAANAFDVLHGRARECWEKSGKIPNLVAVDFYATGDVIEAVDALNGVSSGVAD
jgi:hypothetical protein